MPPAQCSRVTHDDRVCVVLKVFESDRPYEIIPWAALFSWMRGSAFSGRQRLASQVKGQAVSGSSA